MRASIEFLGAASTMSLAVFCSGNYHQLCNNLASNSPIRFLGLSTRWIPHRPFYTRKYEPTKIVSGVRWESHNSITPCGRTLLKFEKVTVRSSRKDDTVWKRVRSSASKDAIRKPEKLTVGASIDETIKQPKLHDQKAVHCYSIQETTSVKKSTDWPATILVFDIETTAFSPQKGRIIELAIRDLTGGKNSTFQTLVNPETAVLNSYVHGIYSGMVNRPDVPTFRELIPILLQYVQSRQIIGRPVLWVAHNGRRFDVPFIKAEFQRCSMDLPEHWKFVDTFPFSRRLVKPDGSKLSSHSLNALREHYGIPLVGPAHRAMQDVTTLCYVLQKITFDLKLTVPKLMDAAFHASDI